MSETGRRARNALVKTAAIAGSAEKLFRSKGYAATTTAEVARAADVAEGTVFRYAQSKPELLLMVVNRQLGQLVAQPRTRHDSEPTSAVLAILAPIVELVAQQPAVAAPFLQELLFGSDGPHRRHAWQLVDELLQQLADVLRRDELPMGAEEAASWVFSVLVSELLRVVAGRGSQDPKEVLRVRVEVLLRGLGVV